MCDSVDGVCGVDCAYNLNYDVGFHRCDLNLMVCYLDVHGMRVYRHCAYVYPIIRAVYVS